MPDDSSYMFMIGMMVGIIISFFFFVFISTSSTTITYSHYTAQVEGIYNNSPSYVQFPNNYRYYGNLSTIKNLSINQICTLTIVSNQPSDEFVNGTCTSK